MNLRDYLARSRDLAAGAGPRPTLVLERNLIDRAIAYVAPRLALDRVRARANLELVFRHFEGAANTRRTEGWRAPPTDANAAARGQIGRLRDRCRDTARNNAWGRRAVKARSQNVIGAGIVAKWTHENADDKRLPILNDLWARWALTKEIDAEGRRDFYGMQRLAARALTTDGELLFRRRIRRPSDGLTIPLQLQAIEADHIDDFKDGENVEPGTKNKVRDVQGVRFDAIGRRVGYWLFPEHPGSAYRPSFQSVLVPASELLHVFEATRAGQVRGIPALAVVLILLRDLDEYEDASLVKAKVAALFTAFVVKAGDDDLAGMPVATTKTDQKDGTPLAELEPGTLQYLQNGESVSFSNPPLVESFDEFTAGKLRKAAAGIGITFEQLTGDYSRVNFTSGRMGWLENSLEVLETRWDVIDPCLLTPTAAWFLQMAELAHGISPDGISVEWTEPAREMLDPTRETSAKIKSVRGGFRSVSDWIRADGRDPRAVFKELSEERKEFERLGLKLETNPADDANAQAGDTTGDPKSVVVQSD